MIYIKCIYDFIYYIKSMAYQSKVKPVKNDIFKDWKI